MKSGKYKKEAEGKPPKEWLSWEWQLKNIITSTGHLKNILPLPSRRENEIELCLKNFRMAVTPYYASLMNPANENCPIMRQGIPSIEELCVFSYENADPLNEEGFSPVKNIVHRYPDRVLFLVTNQCATYCRHCTRRRIVGQADNNFNLLALQKGINYIKENKNIRDVLISGGDPLLLSDGKIEYILHRLRKISHVEIIRIGTRVPVVLPMRITKTLIGIMKKYHPLWINTHFNHPDEITPISSQACQAIVDAGIPLGNQTVLLKGINDNVETLRELFTSLVKIRVRPYYLYQCDLSCGLNHFRTDISKGKELIGQLTGRISGFAIPKFVVDAPGGGGKIPVNDEYIVSEDGKNYVLKNYENKHFTYPKIN